MTSPENLAAMFKVLSVGTRLQILHLLKERPMCQCARLQFEDDRRSYFTTPEDPAGS